MREILFRGKRIDNGEWVEGCGIIATENWVSIFTVIDDIDENSSEVNEIEVIPDTVGQYTGLDDKCGNKIFEGDIVKHHNFGKTEYTSVVKFGEYEQDGSDGEYAPTECIGFYVEVKSYFVLYYSGDWEPRPYLLQRNLLEVAKSCEVIGNIYDNPELLKEIDKE